MYSDMKDKVAIITGGGSGIGQETAMIFAKNGAKIVVADLSEEGGNQTVSLIKQAGGEASFVKVNVADANDVKNMVDFAVNTYGGLHYAFNNAGIDQPGRDTVATLAEDDWDKVINVNLKSVYLCMKYELAHMLENGGGAIVNTSSGAGIKGVPGLTAYCASKHGVIGLTRSAALDHARQGVRINVVCPGLIKTHLNDEIFDDAPDLKNLYVSMQPMGRIGQPQEIGEAVAWLCSDSASLMNGAVISVDGGFSAQ